MRNLVTRLRTWVHAPNAVPVGDLLDEAADEIESQQADWPEQLKSLVKERDYWMRTARAFDEHLATLRVAMMEHPTVRFGAVEARETVQCPRSGDCPTPENGGNADKSHPTLTAEEREAIDFCVEGSDIAAKDARDAIERGYDKPELPIWASCHEKRSATLRGLLERL